MDFNDVLDLEELESMLYSQIYHSSGVESVEELEADIVPCDFQVDNYRRNYRYFENSQMLFEPQPYIPLTNSFEAIHSSVQNTESNFWHQASSSLPNEETDISQQSVVPLLPNSITNNITVNQYSIPFVVNGHAFLSSNPYKHLPHWLKEQSVKNSRSKKVKNKKKKNIFANLSEIKRVQQNTVTIYISDSDSDDCIEVEGDMRGHKINTKFPKKYNEADGDKLPEVDDDVIFIPPPPIEVVTVDIDDQRSKNVDKIKHSKKHVVEDNSKCEEKSELLTTLESSISNDFLENANIEPNTGTNFNFSLHGSDFNNGVTELGQVSKPTEYCETESSCSTNEHSRDFSNTVKTIVFDEVEFPKEDIFSEKNLETFGSFITPKRSLNKSKESINKTKQLTTTNEYVDNSSNTSSSESDYEANANKKIENLPNLSPMILYETLSAKDKKTNSDLSKKKKKKEDQLEVEKCKKKKRCFENDNSKELTITEVEVSNDNNVTSTPNSKSKRKKKKREHNTSTSLTENSIEYVSKDDSEILKKKKKKRSVSTPSDVSKCKTPELDDPKIIDPIEINTADVNVIGKKQSINSQEINFDINHSQESEKSKNKKKKTISTSSNLTDSAVCLEQSNHECTPYEATRILETSEKSKKKRKKRGNISESSIDDISGEKSVLNMFLTSDKDNSLKDINNYTVTFQASEKLKRNKNENISDNFTDIHSNESEILPKECNTNVDITSEITEQCEISDIPKITDTSKQPVEIDNNKSKKSRKRNSRGSSTTEKLSQNILEIEQSKKDESVNEKSNSSRKSIEVQINAPSDTIEISSDIDLENEENNTIILDSDLSSHSDSEVIISSDSESDLEMLDDIRSDLSLNCLDRSTVVDATETSDNNQDYQSFIQKIRSPLENYDKYDIDAVQSQQSDNPDKWVISYKDRATYLNQGGSRGPRCNRCKHFGHIGLRCPDKPNLAPCSLCGESDHQEPRCPNKMCTQCGNRGDYSTTYCYKCFKFRHTVCNLCKMIGHIENFCPDLWRRYHLTTDQGPMVTRQGQIKPKNQQWCSGCAKQGHLEHECNYYNRVFPPTTPYVMKFDDCLKHNTQITAQDNVLLPSNVPPLESRIETPCVSLLNEGSGNVEIPSLLNMSISAPPFNVTPTVNTITIPNMTTPNLTIQVSNDLQNRPTESSNKEIVFSMNLNFNNADPTEGSDHIDICDINQIRKLIMSMPHHLVTDFLKKEMDQLHKNKIDLRLLKRKIFKFDRIVDSKKNISKKILHQKDYWYRLLNMFVFGIHKYKDGKLHVNYLRRYLSNANNIRLNDHKRMSLFSSYSYIFGCNQHVNVNYYKIIRLLIRKYCNPNNVVQ